MAEKSNRLCTNQTEISTSSPMTTPLSAETITSGPTHPDAQTPTFDQILPTTTSQDGNIPPLQSGIFSWMSRKVDRMKKRICKPAGWNLGLTLFSAIFAISFGVFTILAWVVAVQANQKADLAIRIAKHQYILDEYNMNLTRFAAKLAVQARDDGRLSNRLQYYALCMNSNSTLFPGLCERLVPGSDESMESFAIDFNNTFPLKTGLSPDPSAAPSDDLLSKPPKLWDGALSSRLFDDVSDEKGGERRLAANHFYNKEIFPAIVMIPAILVLAVVLTAAIH